jgi:threonine aldolase
MRQAGILAAGALYALDHHVERLAQDHLHAKQLAEGLAALPGVKVDVAAVETNLVYAQLPRPAAEVLPKLKAAGLLLNAEGPGANRIRLVTHLEISDEDVTLALDRLREVLA